MTSLDSGHVFRHALPFRERDTSQERCHEGDKGSANTGSGQVLLPYHSSFPRRRESSEASHGHVGGIRSFLMRLPMTTDLVTTTAYWIPGLRPG